jgi:hypothetical protein
MNITIQHRLAVSLAVALFAALAVATVARADAPPPPPPPPLASVQAGPLATQIGSIVTVGPVTGNLGGGTTTSPVSIQVDAPLASLQAQLTATQDQMQAAGTSTKKSARAKVRSLRAKARSLKRRAAKRAASVQSQAIAQANATADGVWVVVNGAGVVLDQSGGAQVTQVGTGSYQVSFTGSACPNTSTQVQTTGPSGPANGGFFFTATC